MAPPRDIEPELTGQRALVTGAGRGIGCAIALALADAGASVAVASRTPDEVEAVAAAVAARDVPSLPLTADMAVATDVAVSVKRIEEDWGGVDILVNNAGILGPIGPVQESDPEAWLDTLRVNLGGPYLCSRAVLPGMLERRFGRIVNLSGGGAVSPRPWFSAYGAAKAGVVRFTETLAAELAGTGVQVNAVAPGAVNTRMTEQAAAAGDRAGDEADAARRQLDEGGASPEGAAALVVWLASPRSGSLTGRTLSAAWDDWERLDVAAVMASEAGTMRRIKP